MALASPFLLSSSVTTNIARTWGGICSARTKIQAPVCSRFYQRRSARPRPRKQPSFQGSGGTVLSFRAILALSAAAALAFFRRKQGAQQYWLRQFMACATNEKLNPKITRIDGHLHVWASPEEAIDFPYFPGQEPTLPGSAAYLVKSMSEAELDGALIIQPINHKFDHTYVSSVLQKYPGKFVGCCLADPSDGGGGVSELERLISKEGYRAVRFNPYLWPSGEKMSNKVGKALFSKAGELGAVVGFMCFKGLLLHVDDIEKLCGEFPSTTVMIDHFGFCKPEKSNGEAEAWKRLLGLAQFPQVYVKVSAFNRVSREPFPYKDTWPLVQGLLNAFGAKRLLWGSDFPFIAAECGYAKANHDLPQLIAETLPVSESEMEYLLGGTALQLFEGAWQESPLVG